MATTKTTKTTKKEDTVVESNNTVENATVENVVSESKPESTVKKYADDDPIPCESITVGELGMIGQKTGTNYTWACYGDVVDVDYIDLVTAIRTNKQQVVQPMFIIKDEDFLSKFPKIVNIYNSMYTTSDFEEIFDLPVNQMRSVIMNLPAGVQQTMLNMASDLIASGRLDSVQKIQALDQMFDTKLMLITGLES